MTIQEKDIADFPDVKVLKISYEVSTGSYGGNLTMNFDTDPPQRKVFRLKSGDRDISIISPDAAIAVTDESERNAFHAVQIEKHQQIHHYRFYTIGFYGRTVL